MKNLVPYLRNTLFIGKDESLSNPFTVIVRKEIAGQIRSWRFIVLLLLIAFTFLGAMYVSMTNINTAVAAAKDSTTLFLYLKLLTITDGTLPSFHVLLSFLGPLLGIGLGFDALNAEQQNGTLARIMAQPIYRDNILLSKFVSALILIGILFLSLALLMVGSGILITGVMIEPEEVLRIISFVTLCIVYVGFWLALSILLSIIFRQAATSALTAIGLWLFFTVFYQIVVHLGVKAFVPRTVPLLERDVAYYNEIILTLLRLAPNQQFSDATTSLLMPSLRSLGPLSIEQMSGAIPSALPFGESLLIVWPQVSGLVSATIAFFALSYYLFMRREIRT